MGEKELNTQMKRQISAHADHIKDVLEVQEKELNRIHERALDESLSNEHASHKQDLAQIKGWLDALEQSMVERESMAQAVFESQKFWLACVSLQKTVEAGADKATVEASVGAVVDAVQNSTMFREDVLVQTLLNSIPKADAPASSEIKTRFNKVEAMARRTALVGEEGGSLMLYVLSYLQSLLIIPPDMTTAMPHKSDDVIDVASLNTFDIAWLARKAMEFNDLVIKATEDIATVTSPWLSTNTRTREDGTEVEESKGFGFVNFESHEGALRALERFRDMNKMREVVPELLHPKEDLYAAEAMNKNKRRNQLGKVPHNRNLYIKNIAETVTDKQLEELFAQFGEIVSTKIMVNEDTGVKRGFGFVCFKNPDDARKAITQMNNFHLEGKPLYVALAQPKEARCKQLEIQFAQRMMPPYPYGPFPVQTRAMVPPARMRNGPSYGNNRGFPMNMGQRGGRPQGNYPHHPSGQESIRVRLKMVPEDHKIQFLGDCLYTVLKNEDGGEESIALRRTVGTLLQLNIDAPLEETISRLVSLCEDREKRAEAVRQVQNSQ